MNSPGVVRFAAMRTITTLVVVGLLPLLAVLAANVIGLAQLRSRVTGENIQGLAESQALVREGACPPAGGHSSPPSCHCSGFRHVTRVHCAL